MRADRSRLFVGGVEGDRIPDLRNAIATLSRLSYDPNSICCIRRLVPRRCLCNLRPRGALQIREGLRSIRMATPVAVPWGSCFAVAFHVEGRRPGDVAFTAGPEAKRRPRSVRRPRGPPPDGCGVSAPLGMSRSIGMALPAGFEHRVSPVLSRGSNQLSYGITFYSLLPGNFVAGMPRTEARLQTAFCL